MERRTPKEMREHNRVVGFDKFFHVVFVVGGTAAVVTVIYLTIKHLLS